MKKIFMAMSILALAAVTASASPVSEVKAAAAAFFKAQNAHDIDTVSSLLVNSPDVLVIRGPVLAWGHEAAAAQWAELYKGVWKAKADKEALKAVEVNPQTVQLFVPVHFTVGPKEGETKEFSLNVVQLWTLQDGKWLMQSLVATPQPQK